MPSPDPNPHPNQVSTDVFLLQLSASRAVWRTLTEWPASVFSGEGVCILTPIPNTLALALALIPNSQP